MSSLLYMLSLRTQLGTPPIGRGKLNLPLKKVLRNDRIVQETDDYVTFPSTCLYKFRDLFLHPRPELSAKLNIFRFLSCFALPGPRN